MSVTFSKEERELVLEGDLFDQYWDGPTLLVGEHALYEEICEASAQIFPEFGGAAFARGRVRLTVQWLEEEQE